MINDFQKKALLLKLEKLETQVDDVKFYRPEGSTFTCYYSKFKFNDGFAYTKCLVWDEGGDVFKTVADSINKFIENKSDISIQSPGAIDTNFFKNQIFLHLHYSHDFNIDIKTSIHSFVDKLIASYNNKTNSDFFSDLQYIDPVEHYDLLSV